MRSKNYLFKYAVYNNLYKKIENEYFLLFNDIDFIRYNYSWKIRINKNNSLIDVYKNYY